MNTGSSWKEKENALIASLKCQPLVALIRPKPIDIEKTSFNNEFFQRLGALNKLGIKHIEIAWCSHPRWPLLIEETHNRFPSFNLGAASVTSSEALTCVAELKLNYAMLPFWDPGLQQLAQNLDQLLIPGVFTPSEIKQAVNSGHRVVKLFPASCLGIDYISQIKTPLSEIPFIIAAGGLSIKEINPWLNAGCDAITIGKNLVKDGQIDKALQTWIEDTRTQRHVKITSTENLVN